MAREEVRPLVFEDRKYACRVLWHDRPATEPVLIVGGAYQDMYSWNRLEERLGTVATVVSLDLPGYGGADDLPAERGFDALSTAVLHTVDELGIERVNLFGGSYGAPIAYGCAQRHPDRVAHLAMAGAALRCPEEAVPQLRAAIGALDDGRSGDFARMVLDTILDRRAGHTIRNQAAAARLVRHSLAQASPAEAARNAESTRRLLAHPMYRPGGVTGVPSLVFTGEHDPFTTPAMNREVAATIATARFTTVKDADHLVHLERRRELADLLVRFFTDQPLDGLAYCNRVERLPVVHGSA